MNQHAVPSSYLYVSLARIVTGSALIAVGLFWAASTFDWPRAWLFLAVLVGALLLSVAWLWRANPEIFAARRRMGAGTQRWDYAMMVLIGVGFTAVVWVSGYDRRFGWTQLPDLAVGAGLLLLLAGTVIITLAQAANRHFEPSVRIQSDRDHRVIDTGPYGIVRHPGYIGGVLIVFGMAMALGSGWAILPAVALVAILAVRTLLEERTLRAGLPGYTDYTQRVKFRWVPGVW